MALIMGAFLHVTPAVMEVLLIRPEWNEPNLSHPDRKQRGWYCARRLKQCNSFNRRYGNG